MEAVLNQLYPCSTTTCGLTALAVYMAVIRLLRFRRVRGMKLSDVDRDPSEIFRKTTLLEFPATSQKALELMLIRTFGIPSAAAVFHKSRSFVHAGKRYDDTDLLLKEYFENHTESDRANTAVARVNAIHEAFSSEISNADILYSLALFATLPAILIDRLEWRRCTDIEKAAFLAYYQIYGERLGIKGAREWKTWDDAHAHAQAYEAEYFQRSEGVEELVNQNMDLLLSPFPSFLKPLGRKAVCTLLDPPLLEVLGLSEAPLLLKWFANAAIKLRAMVLLYLVPPRFFPARRTPASRLGGVPSRCLASNPGGVTSGDIPGKPRTFLDADVVRVPQFSQFHDPKQGCLFYKNGYQIKNVGTRKCPAGRLMKKGVPVFTGTGAGGSATNINGWTAKKKKGGASLPSESKKVA
ncbi:unnamed protein product [Ectocarpus fasciculatus]